MNAELLRSSRSGTVRSRNRSKSSHLNSIRRPSATDATFTSVFRESALVFLSSRCRDFHVIASTPYRRPGFRLRIKLFAEDFELTRHEVRLSVPGAPRRRWPSILDAARRTQRLESCLSSMHEPITPTTAATPLPHEARSARTNREEPGQPLDVTVRGHCRCASCLGSRVTSRGVRSPYLHHLTTCNRRPFVRNDCACCHHTATRAEHLRAKGRICGTAQPSRRWSSEQAPTCVEPGPRARPWRLRTRPVLLPDESASRRTRARAERGSPSRWR